MALLSAGETRSDSSFRMFRSFCDTDAHGVILDPARRNVGMRAGIRYARRF
jgi:hypothetical protein